jgi:hypothetical protein
MSLLHLKSLVDEKKTLTFRLAPDDMKEKGKYICEINSVDDEHILFADTIENLMNKLERKDVFQTKIK